MRGGQVIEIDSSERAKKIKISSYSMLYVVRKKFGFREKIHVNIRREKWITICCVTRGWSGMFLRTNGQDFNDVIMHIQKWCA